MLLIGSDSKKWAKYEAKFLRVSAHRRRQTTFEVQPPYEKENVTIILGTLPPTHYDSLIGHASASISNLAKRGEWIEDGMKIGKNKDY